MAVNFKKIESKWQKRWAEKKAFAVSEKSKKKKFYLLEMFPYPSAEGLHMGHALNYSIGDVYARFKRMNGFNVLYPMGFDALGLPAENAAIKAKKHPKPFTKKAMKNYIRQMNELGLSYDWSKTLATLEPEYYKWNQYFFLKFYEAGLIYRKKSPVNYCKKCKTVLANEQVVNGMCWRHEDTEVEIKQIEQWFLKTTNYAEELLTKLNDLKWPERIKTLQKNWIGKSFGTEIVFEVEGKPWKVFTTRPDTIFGVTFMVISAQHSKLFELVTKDQEKEVRKFLKKIKSVSEKDVADLEKEGVFTGAYAKNPVNDEEIPIYAGNFVLPEYGGGMVMAVPAHDKRDYAFAKKYGLKIKQVISGGDVGKQAYVGEGKLINSGKFNAMKNSKAKEEITNWLKRQKLGKKTVNFKLRDWGFSRQRYWGTPLPIIYCQKCGVVKVPEKDLPVKLPEKVVFGKGNPLEIADSWKKVKCPECGGAAVRETDTMDTFFDSSWYYLRYCDNKNKKAPFSKSKIKYWMPVDQYIGGAEHACMHLIYARFFIKVLRDLGYLNFDEPFLNLFNQGMLHGENKEKMSKSKGNVINPDVVSKKYGMDTARFFLLSLAMPDKDRDWDEKGIQGSLKFIQKVMNYFDRVKIVKKSDAKTESKLNKTIKEVTNQIENFKYNLAIIKIRELFNFLPLETSKEVLEKSLKLLNPICPHITEELWEKIGNKGFISLSNWPIVEEKKINEGFEKADEAVDKLRSDIDHIKKMTNKSNPEVFVYVLPNELKIYQGMKNVKVFSVADKTKYDPENKSKKAKPGKPGIYLE